MLNGHKSFVTAPESVAALLISAICNEQADGLRDIGIFYVPVNMNGLTLEYFGKVRVMPELGQGAVSLNNVRCPVDGRLAGASHSSALKPFGVCETIYLRRCQHGDC